MDPITVLDDGDLLVLYITKRGRSALTVFSGDEKRSLAAAEGAVRQVVRRSVRYRPAQGNDMEHIIINYAGELRAEVRNSLAQAIVTAIRLLDN